MKPLTLRTLLPDDEPAFRHAIAEFEREGRGWPFAFGFKECATFPEYLRQLEAQSRGLDLPEGFVPSTFLVGVVDGVIVGRLSLRHSLNDFLASVGGHIGYGVVPSQRRRGYATEMLRQALPWCAPLGIDRALLTCDETNVGSRKVIEACGGVLENIVDCPKSGVPKWRYWINTTTAPASRVQ